MNEIDCSKMNISVINNPKELHGRYQRCCPKTLGTFKSKTPICKQMDKKFKELMNAHYIAPSEVQYGYLKENGDPVSNDGDHSVMQMETPRTSMPEDTDLTTAIIGGIKMKRKMKMTKKSSRKKKSSKKRKQSGKKRSRKTKK